MTMDPLSLLSHRLNQANTQRAVSICPCTEMDDVLAKLEQHARRGNANYEPRDLQVEAVKKFWVSGEIESLRQARLVSFGLAIRPWDDHRCLLQNPQRFTTFLLCLHEWEPHPRQFRKCYQGLLRSYFDYDGLGRDVPVVEQTNWRWLQTYLAENATLLQEQGTTLHPDWVSSTLANLQLFSQEPCAAYAKDLLEGRENQVKHLRQILGITDASWFTREIILSQIDRVCKSDHSTFTAMVTRLLALLGVDDKQENKKENEVLRDRGLKMLLDRYVKVPQTPEHSGLRNYSVDAWGNPWLPSNEYRWAGVSDEARKMVGDWLKRECIELFFTKLAQDGLGDTRRVKFWEKYASSIDRIDFALGDHAMSSHERDFVALRKKLKGLIHPLEDFNSYNNAFIMTMGDLVAVEFSSASNAFYGYSTKHSLPFNLSQPVRNGPVNGHNSLKNKIRALLCLRHQDNIHGYPSWELRFKDELKYKFGLMEGRR